MSTRCQVKVVAEGLPWEAESVTLYHHSGGYPSYMLPIIGEGYQQIIKKEKAWARRIGRTYDPNKPFMMWRGGRPGKAASFLCAADPGNFEPEEGHELRGDIEWYYVLTVVNKSGGSPDEKPEWKVDVYMPPEWEDVPFGEPQPETGARHQFWQNPSFDKLKLVAKGINVSKMTEAELRKKGLKLERRPSKSMLMNVRPIVHKGRHQPGWYREPARHSLAARGIKTRRK